MTEMGLCTTAWGLFHADTASDFAVGDHFAVGDRAQDSPDFLTKRCGFRCERRQEVGLLSTDVEVEPAARLLEYGEALLLVLLFERGSEVFLPIDPKADERRTIAGEGHGAEWRVVMSCVLHGDASFRTVKIVFFGRRLLRCAARQRKSAFGTFSSYCIINVLVMLTILKNFSMTVDKGSDLCKEKIK